MQAAYDLMEDIPNNLGLIINLIPFVFLLGLLFLLVYVLNNRSILSLTTSRPKVDFKRIFFSFGLIVFISIVGFLVSYYGDNSNIAWNFKPLNFFLLLFISLILFPFQIGLEEYLFRGYFMQQIGIAVRNRWFPLLFTSIVFGLFHSANPEVAEMGFGVMVFYIGTGLLLGVMTLMDEGMELALGFHLGNNLMASILLTSEFSALQTDALFKYSGVENTAGTLTEMIISIAITYPIILFILAKKYKWTNWKERLTGKVNPPDSIINE
jgi:membrane protease YdiL (CAAX protease family)